MRIALARDPGGFLVGERLPALWRPHDGPNAPPRAGCQDRSIGACMRESERMARPLAEVDPEVAQAIRHEVERQHSHLELIASENFTSQAVMEATGSVFTNKYAEGYPGKRYYGGCEFTDIVEELARER